MKIIFFGTPEYVIPVVDVLHKKYRLPNTKETGVVGVVTQPPSPAGRSNKLQHSPVDIWAWERKLTIVTELISTKLPKADLGIVAAYGKIIPENIIKHFPKGILNLHPSLLPTFRGASPVQAAIVTGTNPTGLTVIKMDKFLDHGSIVSSFKEDISSGDTTETLRQRLFEKSAQFLIDLIQGYLNGKIKLKEQDHKKATFTKTITREDGFIPPKYLRAVVDGKKVREKWQIRFMPKYNLQPTTYNIERFIRAMSLWPGAWTFLRFLRTEGYIQKRFKILKAHVKDNCLILDEVQLEGKKPVSFDEFVQGYPKATLVDEGM